MAGLRRGIPLDEESPALAFSARTQLHARRPGSRRVKPVRPSRPLSWLALGPTALGWLLLAWPSESAAAERLAARAAIRAGEAAEHIAALADDALEGREGGRRGGRAAGSYVEQAVAPLGLLPAGDRGGFFQSFAGGTGTLRNVLALSPGSDPTCRHELVVIGAHYDHVGYGNARNSFGPFGFVHNGADDNASGVAGLIEIAEALAARSQPPRRPVLLAFWDGEEQGLLGSRHFLRNRPEPLRRFEPVFSINLDMIGRLRGQLEVFGARSAVGLEQLVTRVNSRSGGHPLQLAFDWKVEPDSDHFPFLRRQIPTLMFHTGLHDDYHRPSDDVDRVNFAGLEPVASLALATLLQVADSPEDPPAFRVRCLTESNASRRRLEAAASLPTDKPGRWGIGTRRDDANPTAPVVVAVRPGSPADRGGLQLGDRLIAIGDRPLGNQQEMVELLQVAPTGIPLTVRVARKGRLVSLTWQE